MCALGITITTRRCAPSSSIPAATDRSNIGVKTSLDAAGAVLSVFRFSSLQKQGIIEVLTTWYIISRYAVARWCKHLT